MKTSAEFTRANELICEYRLREFQTCLVKEHPQLYSEQIKSSLDSYNLMAPFFKPFITIKEVAYAIFLNRNNMPIGIYKVSEGGLSGTVIDKILIAKTAIELLATSVILAHNHPSGTLKESRADISVTKDLKAALGLFEIALLDHLILTSQAYKSFADDGLM
jgi:DNA repair protein RadC